MAKNTKQKSPVEYWREVMGGKYLIGDWLKHNIKFILFIIVLVLIYISNRYNCQQAMLEGKQLSDTLLDRKYKALTAHSQLLEKTLRSHIEENLTDSTIQAPTEIFVIKNE